MPLTDSIPSRVVFGNFGRVSTNSGGTSSYYSSAIRDGSFNYLCSSDDGATITSYTNGTATGSDTITTPANKLFGPGKIGAWLSGATIDRELVGDVGEVLIYSPALSSAQLAQLHTYLGAKWGTFDSIPVPHQLPDLAMWFDATDVDADGNAGNEPANNAVVASWKDKSGYGFNGTGGGSPTYKTNQKNTLPMMNLNGSQYFSFPNIGESSGITECIVFTRTAVQGGDAGTGLIMSDGWNTKNIHFQLDNSDNHGVLGMNGVVTDVSSVYTGTLTNGSYYYLCSAVSSTNGMHYTNGAATGSFNVTTTVNKLLGPGRIGAWLNGSIDREFIGTIGEVLVFSSALNSTQISQLNAYLSSKWGI